MVHCTSESARTLEDEWLKTDSISYTGWLEDTVKRLREGLKEIKREHGKVCPDFELCTHPACTSSYSSWAIADAALRGADGVGGPTSQKIRIEHGTSATHITPHH